MEGLARQVAANREELKAELPTGETVSHYRIIAPLVSGRMGGVYLAQDLRLGRRVALKLLPDFYTKDSERLRRFEQEARA